MGVNSRTGRAGPRVTDSGSWRPTFCLDERADLLC